MMPQHPQRTTRRLLPIGVSVVAAIIIAGAAYIGLSNQRDSKAQLPANPSGKVWKQVWADEFNGNKVDSGKWNIENSNFGKSSHNDNCYKPANVEVADGTLRLIAKRQTVTCNGTNPDTGNKTYYFTTGMVTSSAQGGPLKYKFKQGYIEARIKSPKGNPYWPAFWLVGPLDGSTPGWPDYGEVDITEMYGGRPDLTFGTFHYKCSSGSCKTSQNLFNIRTNDATDTSSNFGAFINNASSFNNYKGGNTDFHNYGLWWESNRLTWYVDGRKVRYFDGSKLYRIEKNGAVKYESTPPAGSISFAKVMDYPHSIHLNLAFGGDGPRYSTFGYTGYDKASGYVNGNLVASLPDAMQVDYVRVFQLANAPTSAPSPPPSGGGSVSAPPASGGDEGEMIEDGSIPDDPGYDDVGEAATVEDTSGEEVDIASDDAAVSGDTVILPQLATDESFQQEVAYVEYFVNDKFKTKTTKAPYKFDTTLLRDGTYNLTEKVHFKDGQVKARTAYIIVHNKKLVPLPARSKSSKAQTAIWISVGTAGAVLITLALIPRTRQIGLQFWRRLLRRGSL